MKIVSLDSDSIGDLAEIAGPNCKEILCQLPVPVEANEVLAKVRASTNALFEKLIVIENMPDGVIGAFRDLVGVVPPSGDPERQVAVAMGYDWRAMHNLFERIRSELPANTAKNLVKEYDELLAELEKCAKYFKRSEIVMDILGEDQAVENGAERISSELNDLLESAQAELAARYGWTRGTTRCCPSMGYNPPEVATELGSVHDVEAKQTSGIQSLLRDILN